MKEKHIGTVEVETPWGKWTLTAYRQLIPMKDGRVQVIERARTAYNDQTLSDQIGETRQMKRRAE